MFICIVDICTEMSGMILSAASVSKEEDRFHLKKKSIILRCSLKSTYYFGYK